MKRTAALVVLVAALGVLIKLTVKPVRIGGRAPDSPGSAAVAPFERVETDSDPKTRLALKYATERPPMRGLVARVAERFGRNAEAIERTDGLRGLVLLDRLDMEAIFLYEKHPSEFHRLRDFVGDDAAAEILLHWREYFGLKRAYDNDRSILIAEIASLTSAQQRLAARFPNILPLILADPSGVTEFVEQWDSDEKTLADVLAVLAFTSLERGCSELRSAIRTFEQHGPLALESFRRHGLEGFALVGLYGSVLEAVGNALPLDERLILLRVNADYIDELSRTHRPETVAGHLRHIAAAGLTEAAGGSPNALRLAVEYGGAGERALRKAGPDAADVVFGDFRDPTLRRQAVDALANEGSMALAVLDKYAADPDFREILRAHGGAVIPAIMRSDAGPETVASLGAKNRRSFTESLALAALFASADNGQATIRMIRNEGLERVAQLNQNEIRFYQFLPLYDVIHLSNIVARGYSPTTSEMTWAVVDGCFVIADVLTLAAIQPEGAIASESLRAEVRAAVRERARSAGRELAEASTESAGKTVPGRARPRVLEGVGAPAPADLSRRWARWWTVRKAGGVYRVLRQLPEALPQLTLAQVTEMAAPLATKAGMRLSLWKPIRLFKDGTEVIVSIPPRRGLKYLSAQAVQAGVGVVGFQKMEEHLASRRPQSRDDR